MNTLLYEKVIHLKEVFYMIFKEIRETKENERLKKEEEKRIWMNGAGKIKPETNITVEECNKFWDNLFNSISEEN